MKIRDSRPDPSGLWARVCVTLVFLVPLAVSTAKFGRPFLGQFFINPFQMFILFPWGFAYLCVRRGFMPLKRGGRLERARDPFNFWLSIGFLAFAGATFFIVNLLIAWVVLSRGHR